jgi:hypothetical protein
MTPYLVAFPLTRVRVIVPLAPALQHHDLEPTLRKPVGCGYTDQAAADDDRVEIHMEPLLRVPRLNRQLGHQYKLRELQRCADDITSYDTVKIVLCLVNKAWIIYRWVRFEQGIAQTKKPRLNILEAEMDIWIIAIVLACGAAGGFVNVFIGDSGLHLPKVESGVFQPGFVGVVLVGMLAAMASWASLNAAILLGPGAKQLVLTTPDIANGLLVGFGGAKWFKSEGEKDVLQQTAAVAANKNPNASAAAEIATATPLNALKAALNMP